jgi:pimeloyl-ACP methyl ester carboxylesterase
VGSTARERDRAGDFALVQGRLTAYRLLGPVEAPALLLLHGLGAAGSAWDAVAANLAADHRLVIPDLLGSGRTAKPLIEYRPDELAVHVAGLLEGLGISALAAAAGHSQGAAVAAELCSLWSKGGTRRVEKLVLVDPPPPAGVPWLRPVTRLPLGARSAEIFSALLPHRSLARLWLGFLYADRSRVTDEVLAEVGATSAGRGYAAATARALHSLARLDLHLEHAPPSLLLWGAEDRVFPPSLAREWERRLPNSRCAILPATGHCPHEEQPEAVAFAIREFLAQRLEKPGA